MAKLKAPLMSLGASGALGKSLVFFAWKGIDAVREYVVPSNPQTAPQTTQRGYLSLAIEQIHIAMAQATHAVTEADKSAWALLGSLLPTPMTWFNRLVKLIVDNKVAGKSYIFPQDGTSTPGAGQLAMSIWDKFGDMTAGTFYLGTSPSALLLSQAAGLAGGNFTGTKTGLTTGVKYYWQFRPSAPAAVVGCNSGIYYGTPT